MYMHATRRVTLSTVITQNQNKRKKIEVMFDLQIGDPIRFLKYYGVQEIRRRRFERTA